MSYVSHYRIQITLTQRTGVSIIYLYKLLAEITIKFIHFLGARSAQFRKFDPVGAHNPRAAPEGKRQTNCKSAWPIKFVWQRSCMYRTAEVAYLMVCPGAVAANYQPKRIISCCQAHLIRSRKIKQARVVCECESFTLHLRKRPSGHSSNATCSQSGRNDNAVFFQSRWREKKEAKLIYNPIRRHLNKKHYQTERDTKTAKKAYRQYTSSNLFNKSLWPEGWRQPLCIFWGKHSTLGIPRLFSMYVHTR